MQLIDVITRNQDKQIIKVEEVFADAEDALSELEAGLQAAKSLKYETAHPMIKSLFETLVKARASVFKEKGWLTDRLASAGHFIMKSRDGKQIEFMDSTLDSMSTVRTLELSDLRKAADALGYLLLPWQYFNTTTLANEPKAEEEIEKFIAKYGKNFHIYVLCPTTGFCPKFYAMDVALVRMKQWSTPTRDPRTRYATGEKPPVRYSGSPECYGLGLGAEVLRTLIETTEDVPLALLYASNGSDDEYTDGTKSFYYDCNRLMQFDDGNWHLTRESLQWAHRYAVWLRLLDPKLKYAKAFKHAEAALKDISQSIEKVCKEMQGELKKAREKRGALPVATPMEGATNLDFDPIMFAVPKKVRLTDDGEAILGPCWGPDLPKELLALLMPIFGKGGSK